MIVGFENDIGFPSLGGQKGLGIDYDAIHGGWFQVKHNLAVNVAEGVLDYRL